MRLAEKLVMGIVRELMEKCDINYCEDYAEPGYSLTCEGKGIFFSNWNKHRRLQDVLERLGYRTEWSDEWTACSDCSLALRTMPDCYHWQNSYISTEYDIFCLDCAKDHFDDIEFSYNNNPNRALPYDMKSILVEHGYLCVLADLHNGLHSGMADNPSYYYTKYRNYWDNLIFVVEELSQFYTVFSLWGKREESEEGEDNE